MPAPRRPEPADESLTMQICNKLNLVGSEQFGLSHLLDCNCYLIDYGDGLVLIDAGIG